MDRNKVTTAVIIANGRFPNHTVPLSYIEEAEYIVCCDGAANDFIARGGVPDAIVGDCDSISEENRIRFAGVLHPDPDQETNDLTKSVRFCVENGIQEIIIVGGTGKREDHTIGNISLLADYAEIAKVVMVTDWGIFTPIQSSKEFKSYKGEQVSIFAIDPKELTTHNLKYPVKGRILTNWWQGSLNESLGDSFTIEPQGRVIVFQVYK
ncbi:thiamine diphosphokinase [Proteiniphilum acetatigenes]|uniref:thiamine diphosphokinase n=1 Tax=Proteiniphilum acetatigenes TaxID=294710 RepID=UPI000371F204|nr:thiamine diphosphokinase [Proteiniphilum acetatigenes]